MKLVSFTMSGNREATIGRAMASAAAFADICLLVDTGITDKTIEAAREAAKDKLRVVKHPWQGRFDVMRNLCIEEVNKLAKKDSVIKWGVMLDSDEWLEGDFTRARAALEKSLSGKPLFLLWAVGKDHSRERIFRLPTFIRFTGATHESATYASQDVLEELRVACYEKTPEDMRAKQVRDRDLLKRQLEEEPNSTRWWYYLGQAEEILGNTLLAVDAYERCAELRGNNEEGAWAYFCASRCWDIRGEHARGLDAAALGLTRRPDFAELAWYAAYHSLKLGLNKEAVEWAEISLKAKSFEERDFGFPRKMMRFVPGLYEKPFEVLEDAYKNLGLMELSVYARVIIEKT